MNRQIPIQVFCNCIFHSSPQLNLSTYARPRASPCLTVPKGSPTWNGVTSYATGIHRNPLQAHSAWAHASSFVLFMFIPVDPLLLCVFTTFEGRPNHLSSSMALKPSSQTPRNAKCETECSECRALLSTLKTYLAYCASISVHLGMRAA